MRVLHAAPGFLRPLRQQPDRVGPRCRRERPRQRPQQLSHGLPQLLRHRQPSPEARIREELSWTSSLTFDRPLLKFNLKYLVLLLLV